jgi:hypothetical protein
MASISFIVSQYVEQGRLPEAIDLMQDFLTNKNQDQIMNDLIQLESRLRFWQDNSQKGLINFQESQVEYNKIVVATLKQKDLIKKLEEQEAQQAQNKIEDPEINALLYANVYATMGRDLEGVMKTIHPESPGFEQNRQFHAEFFQNQQMDLIYEIKEITVRTHEEKIATVEVRQLTKQRLQEMPFRENEVVQIYTLKRFGGLWKIFDSVIKRIEYFDI